MANDEGVAAVDRALSILDAFAEHDQKLTLAEISKRTKLYKSTVLRLTKSLEKFGYLRRSEEGAYRLGSKVLFLGSLYQRHFRTLDLVPQVLRQMVEELQEGASLYVRDVVAAPRVRRPKPKSMAAEPSRGAKRAPAAPAPATSNRRFGEAAASSSDRSRATTRKK